MRIINLKLENSICYPVGPNIQYNIPIITEMTNAILNLDLSLNIALCCRGSSGAIIAGIMSLTIPNCTILHSKKENEFAHNTQFISIINDELFNYIIVDDFAQTGET